METIFLSILQMSGRAAIVILAVLLIRLLLRRAPKKWSYLLWIAPAFRLCCPVSWQSVFSLFSLGSLRTVTATPGSGDLAGAVMTPHVNDGLSLPGAAVTAPPEATGPVASVSPVGPQAAPAMADPAQTLLTVLIVLWCAGMLAMLLYAAVSYLRAKRHLRTAVRLRDNIYESDAIRSPFILGIFRPKIYVPFGLDGDTLRYVLAHENTHLRRRDYLVKPFAFLLLTVHWFNPLCWLAFWLMGKDMEMSCDERVLREWGVEKRDYSTTLLTFATERIFPSPSPLAFGETGVKSRIRNILNWRRPRLWVTLLAVVLCAAVIVACAADPAGEPVISDDDGVEEGAGEERDGVQEEVNSLDFTAQIALIAENAETWRVLEELDGWGYVVTDLDQNGRLEIITAEEHGTGHFSTNRIWEVSADGKSLVLVRQPERMEGESEADLLFDTVPMYYDSTQNLYHYVFSDLMRTGGNAYYENLRGWTLFDGALSETMIARKATVYENSTPTVNCTDAEELPISEAEYDLAADRTYASCQKLTARLAWIRDLRMDEVSQTDLIDLLKSSWAAYGIEDFAQVALIVQYDGSIYEEDAWEYIEALGEKYGLEMVANCGRTDLFSAYFKAPLTEAELAALIESLSAEAHIVGAVPGETGESDFTFVDYHTDYKTDRNRVAVMLRPTERIDVDGWAYCLPADQATWQEAWDAVVSRAEDRRQATTSCGICITRNDQFWTVTQDGAMEGRGGYIAPEDARELVELIRELTDAMEYEAVRPEDLRGIVTATLELDGSTYVMTDPEPLSRIESLLTNATETYGMSSCWYTSLLTLTLSDGSEKTISIATDSCGMYLSDGMCFRFANGNEEFYSYFGVTLYE